MNKGLVLVKVLGTRSLYAYPSCLICHKKIRKLHDQDGRLWCSTCLRFYTKKNVHYRYHVNLIVSDCSGIASVTVFGQSLETFFGLKATEFCRYVMKCGRKNSLQGFDIDKMVHLAMERYFAGKMVYLAFHLTKGYSQSFQANVLPASKSTYLSGNCKIPELLANAMCKVESEKQHRSIADVLTEYFGHFEKSCLSDGSRITGNCTGNDFLHPTENKENETLLDESRRDQDDDVSPRNLLCVSSDVNKLVLSMMSSDNDSSDVSSVGNLSTYFRNVQSSTCFEQGRVSENLTLSHLRQSFCCTDNTGNPCIWTSIRGDSSSDNPTPKGARFSKIVSVEGQVKPLVLNTVNLCLKSGDQLDMLKYEGNHCNGIHVEETCAGKCFSKQDQCRTNDSDFSRDLTHSPNVNSTNNEFDMFDSPTSEDLDAFLAHVTLSWPSAKPEQSDENLSESCCKDNQHCPGDAAEPNFTSDFNIVSFADKSRTCLTSTPSLGNHSYHKTSHLEGFINSTYSPINSECISTPPGRNLNDIKKNIYVDYNGTPDMLGSGEKKQSEAGLSSTPISQFECTSSCLCSSISRKTKCKKSSGKVSSKGKQKSKNLWSCILSTKKSTLCSSQLKNAAHVSPRPQSVLLSQNVSPVSRIGQAMPKMWTENSLLLFENESDINESKEECTSPRHNFKELSSNSIPVRSELDVNATSGDRTCPKNNSFDEEFTSTCYSPLLFSQ